MGFKTWSPSRFFFNASAYACVVLPCQKAWQYKCGCTLLHLVHILLATKTSNYDGNVSNIRIATTPISHVRDLCLATSALALFELDLLIDAGLASVFPRPALTLSVLDASIALIGLSVC